MVNLTIFNTGKSVEIDNKSFLFCTVFFYCTGIRSVQKTGSEQLDKQCTTECKETERLQPSCSVLQRRAGGDRCETSMGRTVVTYATIHKSISMGCLPQSDQPQTAS